MSEKVHLENYNYTSSLTSSLCSLLSSSSLCDCTLICSDGQLSAHKVILAASSSFFSSVFSLHHHNHPLIYLRGVKTHQMQAVLSVVYQGATQLDQEDLPSFLTLAEDLKIGGLARYSEKTENVKYGKDNGMLHTDLQTKKIEECHLNDYVIDKRDKIEHTRNDKTEKKQSFSCTEESIQSNVFLENTDQIEEDIEDEFEDSNMVNKMITNTSENVSQVEEEKLAFKSVIDMENTEYDAKVRSNNMLKDHADTDPSDTEAMDKETKKATSYPKELNDHKIVTKYKKCKSKEPKFLPGSLITTVSCPVCKMKNKDTLNLKKHMKTQHEVQCDNCMLYFRNCNSLNVHKKSRCRNINMTINK